MSNIPFERQKDPVCFKSNTFDSREDVPEEYAKFFDSAFNKNEIKDTEVRGNISKKDCELFANPIKVPAVTQERLDELDKNMQEVIREQESPYGNAGDIILEPISAISMMSVGRAREEAVRKILLLFRSKVKSGPLNEMVDLYIHLPALGQPEVITLLETSFRAYNRLKAYKGYYTKLLAETCEQIQKVYS